HLVDAAGEDPIDAYRVVRGELAAYGAGLEDKPEVLALSRADLVDPKDMAKLAKKLAKVAGVIPFVVSAATGDGLDPLLDAILDEVGGLKQAENEHIHEGEWSPL
ncbi:MAG: GTPase ObgE, partial [Sphingomonas bacterium]|nr:GTPase ObgE [Sphingomonas bacterium]